MCNFMCKSKKTLILWIVTLLQFNSICFADEIDRDTLLTRVDAYREFAPGAFSFDFRVSEEGGGSSLMRVFLDKSRDKSLAQYREPARYSRRVVLTLGNSFYIYDQGMMAPIRISPREMLFGQASAGDITRITFAACYSILEISEQGDTLLLELKAQPNRGATYDLINLWIDKRNYRPVSAQNRGASGNVIKTITYDNFERIGSRELLTSFTITDELTHKKSTVTLGNFNVETLPPDSFTVEGMTYVR